MANQDGSYKDKLARLRSSMKAQGVDGFLVPRADEYQGEFVAAYAERLKWLTGFTGSAGMAVVLHGRAVVLTDARYTIQAPQQIDKDIWSTADSADVNVGEWLAENLQQGIVGFDPLLHTPEQIAAIEKNLADDNIVLKPVINLIDGVWTDQPDLPKQSVVLFPDKIVGVSAAEKCKKLTENLKPENIDAYVFTLPDSIAWLLNIRGSDVNYIPVALSYASLEADGTLIWFIEPDQVSKEIIEHLGNSVEIVVPNNISKYFEKYKDLSIGLDFKRAPLWFKNELEGAGAKVQNLKDPSIEPKAIKSKAEQEAVKRAHIQDGIALVKFLRWLEEEALKGQITELAAARKLEDYRREFPEYKGQSFPTIAGYGANGAIVHYRPTEETNLSLTPPGFLLIDSGAQYVCDDWAGTTDITRTIAIGEISDAMKKHFTLVLKGHIAVASAVFNHGTTGKQIDALARRPLKVEGVNFAHGTGHGVGCYLAVHEEAANLSPKGKNTLKPGMLLSNEPGYYEEGAYGIRTENLVLVQENNEEKMVFETISLAPIDLRAINVDMLDQDEKNWLNTYHKQVYESLSSFLDAKTKEWLLKNTHPI